MNTEDEDVRLVMEAAEALGEHFDAVRVFASRHESAEADGTVAVTWGVGNEFAQHGQVALWLRKQEVKEQDEG